MSKEVVLRCSIMCRGGSTDQECTKNEWPWISQNFIAHTAQKSSSKCQEKINEGECERKPKATMDLPYVTGVSENGRPKDPTLNHHQIGVVYQVPCRDCPQAYVGHSSRTLYSAG